MKIRILAAALLLGAIPLAHAQTWKKVNPNNLYEVQGMGTSGYLANVGPNGQIPPAQLPAATTSTQGAVTLGASLLSGTFPVTNVTTGTSYQALTTDVNICVKLASPSPFTIDLPTTPLANQIYDVTDCAMDSSTYPITIVAESGATIMGQSSALMNLNGENLTIKYVAGDWKIQ